jgi:hypothetical protein
MITIEHVADVLRGAIGVAAGQVVSPAALAAALGLYLVPATGTRARLCGNELHYDDAVDRDLQQYQLARGACAYALQLMDLLRDVSPHALALELCAVDSAPRLAQVHQLRSARPRRQSGFVRGA